MSETVVAPTETRVTVTPGAGGEESVAFAGMLLAMYRRWAKRNRRAARVDPEDPHTLLIEGSGLEGEVGVHRLVRISPFDPMLRRHTSFAAVNVNRSRDDRALFAFGDYGAQVRSYIIDPYQRAVDHKTGAETADVHGVLDGDLRLLGVNAA